MAVNSSRIDRLTTRIDPIRVSINNRFNIPITLFARADVPIEVDAIEQLLAFVSLQETLDLLRDRADFWGDLIGEIAQVVLTPDFHKGSGIPVGTVIDARGFVIPQAIGNDICCGMRLLITDVSEAEFLLHQEQLTQRLREIFFQGQREIPLSPRQRAALLTDGLWGLQEHYQDNAGNGIWKYYDRELQADDLNRVHFQGVLPARNTFAFDDFIRSSGEMASYDSEIGSIGGGNHFVELQKVAELIDGATAHQWGIAKDHITIMVHSGSVGLGHQVGGYFRDQARSIFPTGLAQPQHGFYILPTTGQHGELANRYLDAMHNAANFAFGNRLFLGLMVKRALSEVLQRDVITRLIYDAPHNLIWPDNAGRHHYLHRKGACPAPGPQPNWPGPYAYTGHPVIIPGSMGDDSYLLAGNGNDDAMQSACHGAGRSLTRGRARNVDQDLYQDQISKLRVITPIDPNSMSIKLRRDILAAYHDRLKEEAPYAYKPITPVVATVEDAAIARRVARLWPLMTIKG